MIRCVFLPLALLCAPASALAQVDPEPKPLALAEVVDSAGLYQALAAAPPAPDGAPRRHLFLVRYDSAGALESVRALVRAPSPGGYDSTMAALVRAHAIPRLARREAAGEVLWLRAGQPPRMELVNAKEDHPTLRNTDEVSRRLEAAVRTLLVTWPELQGREATSVIRFTIREDGTTGRASYVSGPRSEGYQGEVLGVVEAMRFRPALIEGVTVESTIELPITLQFQR